MKEFLIALAIALLVSGTALAEEETDCTEYPEACADEGDPGIED